MFNVAFIIKVHSTSSFIVLLGDPRQIAPMDAPSNNENETRLIKEAVKGEPIEIIISDTRRFMRSYKSMVSPSAVDCRIKQFLLKDIRGVIHRQNEGFYF